jgi:hypothetical protein
VCGGGGVLSFLLSWVVSSVYPDTLIDPWPCWPGLWAGIRMVSILRHTMQHCAQPPLQDQPFVGLHLALFVALSNMRTIVTCAID